MNRHEMYSALKAAGCTCVGFEYNDDHVVTRAYGIWKDRGSPKFAVIITDRQPGPDGRGQEHVEVVTPSDETCEPIELE